MKNLRELSLRVRTLLFFILLGLMVTLISAIAIAIMGNLIETRGLDQLWPILSVVGASSVFVMLFGISMIGLLFDINVATPIQGLIRDIQTVLHGNADHLVDINSAKHLGSLPESVRELARELALARKGIEGRIAKATFDAEKQRKTLETVLRDLHEGVVICNLNNQILLYNQKALDLLHVSGELGLGRSLFSVMSAEPILHSFRRLRNRLTEKRHLTHPDGLAAPFIAATNDNRYTLEGQMSLVLDPDEETPRSYVITFADITDELAALGKRDHLLRDTTDGLRGPVANLRAAAEMLVANPDIDPDLQGKFTGVILSESMGIAARLEDLAGEYHKLATGHWPVTDFYSANLLTLVSGRFENDPEIKVVMTGVPVWLRGDSHSLVLALAHLIKKVHQEVGANDFDIEASISNKRVQVDIIWHGPTIASATIDTWANDQLKESIGGMTLHDILEHHRSEMWSEPLDDTRSRLRIPLLSSQRPFADHHRETRGRPEFYDFDLLKKPSNVDTGDLGQRNLRDLTFVVFDTETTGLHPSGGDEMVALAGVRIVNSRLLTGESFARLINPERPIPKSSTKFHGITDDMVVDMPPARVVLPQFATFVEGAVLVAHNAAFDMRFLKMKEAEAGTSFNNPVLDSLLLSVFLHDHTDRHSLDDMAERFGVEIEGRHTALGDSLVTAACFLKMISMLESRGIFTLDQAIAASNEIVAVRTQQNQF